MINNVVLVGRLTRDVELRYTPWFIDRNLHEANPVK